MPTRSTGRATSPVTARTVNGSVTFGALDAQGKIRGQQAP